MISMRFPAPEDPKQAPVWENYVVAQAAQASLRIIPAYAYAVGVEVERARVTLVVQAPRGSAAADEDIDDIVRDLEALLGPDVQVSARVDVTDGCRLRPDDGVVWFFAARA